MQSQFVRDDLNTAAHVTEICIRNEVKWLDDVAIDEAENVLDVTIEYIFLGHRAFGFWGDAFVFIGFDDVANLEKAGVRRDRPGLFADHFRAVVFFRIVRGWDDDAARIFFRRADGVVDHVGRDAADVDDVHARIDEAVSESFL